MIPPVAQLSTDEKGAAPGSPGLRPQRHLGRHPQPNTTPHQPEPHHEVVLLGAVESLHALAEETGMDKEGREPCNRVILQKTKMVRVSLEPFTRIHTESQLTTSYLASPRMPSQVKSNQNKEKKENVRQPRCRR